MGPVRATGRGGMRQAAAETFEGDPRILVTGGCGFIGAALIRYLLAQTRACVLNFDALTYAAMPAALNGAAANPRYAFEQGDVADGRHVRDIIARFRPTWICHLAAETHVDRSIDRPADFVHSNVTGTCTLLAAALTYWREQGSRERAHFRFLHVSTDEVFGSLAGEGCFDETSPYAPNSPYAASKASADHFVRAYHQTYGLPALISNGTNTFGPYQFPEKLIPRAILTALAGKPIPVYGDGCQVRDWLHVDDHARALYRILAGGRPGESYAIGSANRWRNRDLVREICHQLDALQPRRDGHSHAAQIAFVDDRPGHDQRYAVDAGKLRRELDWRPANSGTAGLRDTVAWYARPDTAWRDACRARYAGERLGRADMAGCGDGP